MENYYFKKMKVRWLLVWVVLSFITITFLNVGKINDNILSSNINIVLYLTVLFWLFVSFRKNGINLKRLLVNRTKSKISWGYFIFLELLLLTLSFGILFLLISIFFLLDRSLLLELLNFSDGNDIISTFIPSKLLVPILLAPVVEELLFRGYLFNKWGETMGAKKSMILTSVIFAILHIEGAFIGQFIMGVLCCLVYMKTKNLFVPIVLHMLHNGVVELGLYINQLNNKESMENIDLPAAIAQIKIMGLTGLIVFIILLPVSIILLSRLYKKSDKQVPYLSNV